MRDMLNTGVKKSGYGFLNQETKKRINKIENRLDGLIFISILLFTTSKIKTQTSRS